MAKNHDDLVYEIDDLLNRHSTPATVKKALRLLAGRRDKSLASYTAKAFVLSGDYRKALKAAERGIEWYGGWARMWKAAALVGLGASANQWAPELAAAYESDADVADEALFQPVYAAVREHPAFLKAIQRAPGGPQVASLVQLAKTKPPYILWRRASEATDFSDRASVLDAQLWALQKILKLISAGETPIERFNGRPSSLYLEALARAKAARKALPNAPKKSAFTIGLTFRRKPHSDE